MKRLINSYRGYSASIEFSEDENIFVGSVDEIRDVRFLGKTLDEAIKKFHLVVDRHINCQA